MIVIVTRDDLRDEFTMADEAFALSPISARAVQPSEQDYEAISEAFMETSRGRWFLGEYAKRNRNADTRMVLDAVARIEESLAAQRQPAPESDGLAGALAAIRSAVDEARAAASAALDSLALEENLAPVRKGARVIREISWRLREIGADGRICDLIDSQVSAIQAGCGKISSTGPRTALSAGFDLIEERIGEFGDSDTASPQDADEAIPSPSPAASDETPAAAETDQAATATDDAKAAMSMPAEDVVEAAEAVAVAAEVAEVPAEAADVAAEALNVTSEAADKSHDAADTYDEALLDMVALEMAAPDPADTHDTSDNDSDEIHVAELPRADPIIVAQKPEPMAAPAQPLAIQPSPPPSLQPSLQPSLGSTLIANGIVRRPNALQSDPLAPIRRMSQAEKIAFFS
jgi:hypothetical protein